MRARWLKIDWPERLTAGRPLNDNFPHLDDLRRLAHHAAQTTGLTINVDPGRYWSNGVLNKDHYEVNFIRPGHGRRVNSSGGCFPYMQARGVIIGAELAAAVLALKPKLADDEEMSDAS